MHSARPIDPAVLEIQAQILDYLVEHPLATDSVEGIRTWWVMRRMAELSRPRVQQALDALEAARLVERVVRHDGGVLYRAVRAPAGSASPRRETLS